MKGSFLHCPFFPRIQPNYQISRPYFQVSKNYRLDLSMMLYPADRTTTVIISCRQLFSPKKACLNDMPLIWCFSVKPLNCFFQTGSIKYSQSAPMHHHHLHHQFLGFFFFFKKSLADRGYLSHSRVLSSVVSYPL